MKAYLDLMRHVRDNGTQKGDRTDPASRENEAPFVVEEEIVQRSNAETRSF